jgi:hypothetical protein
MSNIVLHPGLTWETIPVSTVRTMVDRSELLKRLDTFKAEWIEASVGEMGEVTIDMASLFDDLNKIVGG